MAITGSYSTSTGVDFNLVAYYSYEQSIANNTSEVTVTLKLRHKSLNATALSGSYLSVAGNQVSYSKKIAQSSNSVTETTLVTKTVTIQHNDTTGQATCGIKGTFVLNGSYSGKTIGTLTLDETLTLQTIPRASSLSVPSSVNTGSELTVTITPANSTFKHKVEIKVGTTTVYSGDFIPAGTNTKKCSISHSWFPSSTSGSIVVYLHTYRSDGTFVATVYKTVTANVPSNIVPQIDDFIAEAYSGGLSGLYVQGKSTVKLTCTAKMGDGATVSSYAFSGPNLNVSSTSSTTTSAVLTKSGTLTYTVTVTDSRGRQVSDDVQITVYPYVAPRITSIQAQRCLADGTPDNNGTCAKVTVATSHSAISTLNKATVSLSNSKDSYKTETTIITSTNGDNSYSNVYGSGFLADETYTIRATITDAYGASNTLIATLASAQRAFNIAKYGNGVAVGGFSTVDSKNDSGLFECNWPMSVSSDLSFSKLDTEQAILFNDGGSAKITTQIYKGAGNSSTVLGAWDMTNNDPIWIYSVDRWFNIYRPTYIRGGLELTETVTAARGRFTSISDASETSQENVPLRIGDPTIQHLDIDANEIIAKKNATNLDVLYLVGSALGLYSGTNLVATIGSDSTGGYIQSAPVYNRTFTGSANMYINSSGTIGRSTASSERYKKDIESVTNEELDPYKILDIPVRQFRYNEENIPVDGKPDDLYIGLIAEEVNNVYPIATEYTEDGQIEMWNIKMLFPALLKIVQDQQKKIEALEEQINNKAVN